MTETLVTVADAAVPFDYAALSRDVVAVLGYVGESGAADHIWSTQEADAARKAVGAWSGIWVPPQTIFGRDDGHRAAVGMLKVLPAYSVTTDHPVFLDIERHLYDAHSADVRDGITAWQYAMAKAGYLKSYPYAPIDYGRGWVPKWVPSPPSALPTGWVGQQWTNRGDDGGYDLSVFRREVFAAIISDDSGGSDVLDKADKTWIVAQLATLQANTEKAVTKLHSGGTGPDAWAKNVVSIADALAALTAEVKSLGVNDVDVASLATDIAAKLGPDVAASVATELGKRLSV